MADTSAPRRPPAGLSRLAVRFLRRLVLTADLPFERQRARLGLFLRANRLPPGTLVTERRLGGVITSVVTADGATTTDPRRNRVVLHLHGGGYCVGEPAMAYGWAGLLAAATGGSVLLPDYRLAPEFPYPAALDDLRAVWQELTTTVAPEHIVLSGDSAGGGLVLAFIVALGEQGAPLPAGLVLLSPWLDLTADRRADPDLVRRDVLLDPDWLAAAAVAYAGSTDLADPELSPLLSSVAGLPPALVQASADDVLIGDSIRFARAVGEAGGDITLSIANGLWHDFPMQGGLLAAADRAVRQTAVFVERVTGAP